MREGGARTRGTGAAGRATPPGHPGGRDGRRVRRGGDRHRPRRPRRRGPWCARPSPTNRLMRHCDHCGHCHLARAAGTPPPYGQLNQTGARLEAEQAPARRRAGPRGRRPGSWMLASASATSSAARRSASSTWRPACAAAARSASASWLSWESRVSLSLGGHLLGNGGMVPWSRESRRCNRTSPCQLHRVADAYSAGIGQR
jgi:hypothetical protein